MFVAALIFCILDKNLNSSMFCFCKTFKRLKKILREKLSIFAVIYIINSKTAEMIQYGVINDYFLPCLIRAGDNSKVFPCFRI